MGINLAEIQQKVDRMLYNIAEQNRRAYQLFYDPNPMDVELPQIDENGNLITVSIPNRAKIKKQMWDDVNAAVGLWDRTFYVDQINGNDNNPGTSDAPFKTLKKAIDSVPIGGNGVIYLLSNYTPAVEEYITPRCLSINIIGQGKDTTFLTIPPVGDSQDRLKLRCKPYKFFNISLLNLTLELQSTANPVNIYNRGFINIPQSGIAFVGITLSNMKLILNSSFHFVSNYDAYYGGNFVDIKINWNTNVIINDTTGTARIVDFGIYGGGAFL